MTELETLARAKLYMEKLANGINPIDGSVVPDEDVINNVRLSRCFFYVADVLRQVIDNGGIAPQKRGNKLPFSLTIEKQKDFAFSAQPIPVSDIAKRINALIADENMVKISHRAIQDWLISLGLLEESLNSEGKTVKRPTSQGESLGISVESIMGQSGTYYVVVYDMEAQHFIIDNMDAIVERKLSKTENQGQPWLPADDERLKELFEKGAPIAEIATEFKRKNGAIRARLKKLNLIQ